MGDGSNGAPDLDSHYGAVYAAAAAAAAAEDKTNGVGGGGRPVGARTHQAAAEIQEAMKEIRSVLQRAKAQPEKQKFCDEIIPTDPDSPVWVPRKGASMPVVAAAGPASTEEEMDTDLETDRLLGQQRHDDQDFFGDRVS